MKKERIKTAFPGMKPQDLPYEKCKRSGPASLTDTELLAVFFRSGIAGQSCMEIARAILDRPGGESLHLLFHMSFEEFLSIKGIGEVRAVQLLCLGEIIKRAVRKTPPRFDCFSSEAVAEAYMADLSGLECEEVLAVYLDSRYRRICDRVLTKGTVNASFISPREIFLEALRCRAVRVILIHNHPGGDPEPSYEDLLVTRQVAECGRLLEIELYDHLVIGDHCFISMKERGYFE